MQLELLAHICTVSRISDNHVIVIFTYVLDNADRNKLCPHQELMCLIGAEGQATLHIAELNEIGYLNKFLLESNWCQVLHCHQLCQIFAEVSTEPVGDCWHFHVYLSVMRIMCAKLFSNVRIYIIPFNIYRIVLNK